MVQLDARDQKTGGGGLNVDNGRVKVPAVYLGFSTTLSRRNESAMGAIQGGKHELIT